MARSRKTVEVKRLLALVNRYLTVEHPYMKAPGKDRDMTNEEAFRMGMIAVLEEVLRKTENYKGFGYQEGVIDMSTTPATFGDETRRVYY